MISIGFCDDDLSILSELRTLLDQYRALRHQDIRCTAFHSPFDLLAEIERGVRFDILLLDILMPGETGIDAAQRKDTRSAAMDKAAGKTSLPAESTTKAASRSKAGRRSPIRPITLTGRATSSTAGSGWTINGTISIRRPARGAAAGCMPAAAGTIWIRKPASCMRTENMKSTVSGTVCSGGAA